jgi:Pyrimidine dimer DNA glycosylase
MQTFVPLISSFEDIARTLDRARLNKQALEGWQILMTLLELDPQGNHRVPKGWVNHPAVKMWRGHEMALYTYIQAMVDEWKRRGYNSTIGDKAKETIKIAIKNGLLYGSVSATPAWISNAELFKEIASSHRAALLVKDYEWYSQFGWEEDPGYRPESYEYVWPI